MNEQVLHKLKVLAESAKYDVSCSSSGTVRRNASGGVGNTVGGWGICHSFAEDGRCISLLKVMLTNYCIYDCAYCINRISNDIPRATLSVSELVDLTMEFYRRNYIEGLFLSSGVVRNPDYTMSVWCGWQKTCLRFIASTAIFTRKAFPEPAGSWCEKPDCMPTV